MDSIGTDTLHRDAINLELIRHPVNCDVEARWGSMTARLVVVVDYSTVQLRDAMKQNATMGCWMR